MSTEIKYYPFTESMYILRQAENLCGKVYNNLVIMVNLDQDNIDADAMENSINQAISRFPSAKVRMHEFKKSVLEKIEGKEIQVNPSLAANNPNSKNPIIPRIYFIDECDTKCERICFKSEKKLNNFAQKLATTPFPNNYNDCDLFRAILVKKPDDRYAVLLKFYHLIADTYGLLKFCEDFLGIYKAIKLGNDMPKPLLPILPALEECWNYEGSAAEAEDQKFWDEYWKTVATPRYAEINGFENKKAYIPGKLYGNFINIFNTKATQVNYRIPSELTSKINKFALENGISPQTIYLLSLNVWLSKKTENHDKYVYLNATANRSKLKFSNTSGSFSTCMINYVSTDDDMTFLDACVACKKNYFKCIKHGRLNNTNVKRGLYEAMGFSSKELIKLPYVRGYSAFTYTYQPYVLNDKDDFFKISISRYPSGKSPVPIYAMFMPVDNYTGEMNVNFEYSLAFHKEKDFDDYFEFLIKFLETISESTTVTIAELKEL